MNLLFHGPGGRSSALVDAKVRGKLSCEPIGEGGLKVDESRALIEMLLMPFPGNEKKSFVVGPMDEANVNASDALLKSLEDLDHSKYVLNLWAADVMNVSPTIQSRCAARWCYEPGPGDLVDDSEIFPKALDILDAYRKKDYLAILEIAKDKEIFAGAFRLVPEVLSPSLVEGEDERDFILWERVRGYLRYNNLSHNERLAAVLP